jgi:endogenous inhibitor of DNA gyrase (YacG/DUF329 family)
MVMSESCPICRKPSLLATRPFCSQRCADIDLGRWLTAQYVVPGDDGEAEPSGSGEAAGDA